MEIHNFHLLGAFQACVSTSFKFVDAPYNGKIFNGRLLQILKFFENACQLGLRSRIFF